MKGLKDYSPLCRKPIANRPRLGEINLSSAYLGFLIPPPSTWVVVSSPHLAAVPIFEAMEEGWARGLWLFGVFRTLINAFPQKKQRLGRQAPFTGLQISTPDRIRHFGLNYASVDPPPTPCFLWGQPIESSRSWMSQHRPPHLENHNKMVTLFRIAAKQAGRDANKLVAKRKRKGLLYQ